MAENIFRSTIPRVRDSDRTLTEKMAIDSAVTAGAYGSEVISDTNAHPGRYGAIMALGGTAVIATAVQPVGGNLSTVTLDTNGIIRGDFTSITLTSGSVLAYYRPGRP